MTEPSSDLQPGTRLRHRNGVVVTLDRRKVRSDDLHGLPFHPGWWLRDDAGGLADFVVDNPEGDWTQLDIAASEEAT